MQKLDCMRSGIVFFDPNNALNILESKIIKFQKSEKNNPIAPARIKPSTPSISGTALTKADTFDHYTTRAYTGLGGKVNILPQMLDLDKLANMGWFKH